MKIRKTDSFRRYGNRIGNPVEQIEFLNRDSVNLVKSIDNGYISSTLFFDNVDEIIYRRITSERDISRADLVLLHNSPNFLQKK